MTELRTTALYWVPIEVRSAHFFLLEPAPRSRAVPVLRAAGLIESTPGEIRCRTGHETTQVLASVVIAEDDPGPVERFDDVVEVSHFASGHEAALADWSRTMVLPVPAFPGGQAWHRLRYHIQGMDGDGVGECLLQVWAARPEPPKQVKVTSVAGGFWHPRGIARG